MPHGWRCREIEMSWRPASSRRNTSLRRMSGCTVSAPERMRSSTASRYALRRKKWFRSLVGISSSVGCSTQWPSTICAPVLNSSHPVQYSPSYSASNRSAGWCCWIRASSAATARACTRRDSPLQYSTAVVSRNLGIRAREFVLQLLEHHDPLVAAIDPDGHGLAEHIHRQHALEPHRGAQHSPLLGEPLARLHVEVVLVAEAAQQPPAPAGDLRRVERQVLILGERQAHRPQLGEPARAAVLPAAAADAVEPLGLVARPDLAQLDPS